MVNSNSSPWVMTLRTSLMHFICHHRFLSSDLQVTAPHSSSGRCLATPTSLPLSTVQGATGYPAVYMQGLWACPAYVPLVLPLLQLLLLPANQKTLLCFATFLADAKGLQHRTILRYLYGVKMLHIDMGLWDPLKGALWLHKGLWAIHTQSNPVSHKLAFTYELLVLAQPLHRFPTQWVLWASLTMAHFGFLWTGEFMVDQELFNPAWHLCVQDVTPHLTAPGELQHITDHLKVSKTDPFGQGIDVIIGCSGTQVCGACSTWDLIQSHHPNQASPMVPFL